MRRPLTDSSRADWPFVANSAVTLFWRKPLLQEARQMLERLHYEISVIDCTSDDAFHTSVSHALRWREQFGYEGWRGNLDALNDGVASLPFNEHGRAALCFEDFDQCVERDSRRASIVLDIIATQSRRHLLAGCLLLALVQTRKPRFDTGPLGGIRAPWNQKEWKTKSRGLGI